MAVTYQSTDDEIQLTGVVTVGEFRAATTSSGLSFGDGTYTLHSDMRLMASCDLSVFGNVRIDLNGHEVHVNSGTEDIIWRDVQFIESSDRTNADRFPFDRDELGYSARGGSVIATMDGTSAKLAIWARELDDVRILAEDHVANDIDGVLWFNQQRVINGLSLIRMRRVASDMSRIRIRDLSITSNSSSFGPLFSLNRNGSLMLEGADITSLYPDMPSGYATARDFNQNETRIVVNGVLPAIPRGARFRLPLGADTQVYTVEIGADATTETSTGKYLTIKPPLAARKTIGESLHTENSGVSQVVGAFRGNSEHWFIALGSAETWLRSLLPLNGSRVTHIHGGFHGLGGGVRYYRVVGGEGGVFRLAVGGNPEFPTTALRVGTGGAHQGASQFATVVGATEAIPAGSKFRANGHSTVYTVTSDVAAAPDTTTSRAIPVMPPLTGLYQNNATLYPAGFPQSDARAHKPDLTQASMLSTDTETTVGADETVEVLVPAWIARIGEEWDRADASAQTLRGWKYGRLMLEIDCSAAPTEIVGAHDAPAPIPWQVDDAITETDSATVAAYTALDTAAKMYDRLSLYAVAQRRTELPATKTGDVLDFGDADVTLASSGDMIAYSDGAWTLNVGTEYTGGLRTTGTVTVPAGITVTGAIFDSTGDSRVTFTVPSGLDEALGIFTDRATASEDAGPFVGSPALLMVGRSYDTMFAVSTSTGVASTVGQSRTYGWEFGWPTAFAFAPSTRSVWTAERSSNALYSWSLATGETTRVGTATNWGLTGATVEMVGFELQGSTLWACSSSGIYTIDTATGEATAITTPALPSDVVDLSFSSATRLHVLAAGAIHEYAVSGTTLTAARNTALTGQDAATGLAWSGTAMYLVGRSPAAVYTVDLTPATYGALSRIGTATDFGATEDDPSGIAWSPALPIGRLATIPTGRSWRYLASAVGGRTVYLRMTQEDDGAPQLYAVAIPAAAGDHTISVLATPADVARDRILERVEDVLRAISGISTGGGSGSLTAAQSAALDAIRAAIHPDGGADQVAALATAISGISTGGGSGSLTTAQAAALTAIRAAIHPDGGSDQVAALSTAVGAIPTTTPTIPTPPTALAIATATQTAMEGSGSTLTSIEGKIDTLDSVADATRAAVHPSGGDDQIAALATAVGGLSTGGGSGSLTSAQATALAAIRAAIHPSGGDDQVAALSTAVGAIPTTSPSVPTAAQIATQIERSGGPVAAVRAAVHPSGGSDQVAALATAVGAIPTTQPSIPTPPTAAAIATATQTAMEGSSSTLSSIEGKIDTLDAVADVVRAAVHPSGGSDQIAALKTAVAGVSTGGGSGSLTTAQAAALTAIRAAIHPDGGSDQIAALATAISGISSGGGSGSLTAAQAAALTAIRAAIHPSSGDDQIAALGTAIAALTTPPTAAAIATATRTAMEASGTTLAGAAADVDVIRAAVHPSGGSDQVAAIGTAIAALTTPPTAAAIAAQLERADGPLDSVADAVGDADEGLAAIATAIGGLPSPPTVAQIQSALERAGGTLDDIEDDLAALSTAVSAIPTDDAPTAAAVAAQVWASTLDGTLDASTALRAMFAVVAGRARVTATGVDYLRADGTTVALRATVDEQGNRPIVVVDPTV